MATLNDVLQDYCRHARLLRDNDYYDTVVPVMLIDRELVARDVDQLTPAQRQQLMDADEVLVQKWRIVAQMTFGGEHPRSHWWWFLHEGPQVREQAHA